MKVKIKRVSKAEKEAEKVEISTEYIKLDSFLKFAVIVSSGGEAKMVINDGLVSVNGEVCTERGKKLRDGDIVEMEGRRFKVAVSEE